MSAASPVSTDVLVRLSRRGLWCALSTILLLGVVGAAQLAFPESIAGTPFAKLAAVVPLAIIFATGAAKRPHGDTATSAAAMQAVLDDELRQASLNRSYRNAFFAVLMLQPPLALLLTATSATYGVALMAGASVVLGGAVLLGCLLYYDR